MCESKLTLCGREMFIADLKYIVLLGSQLRVDDMKRGSYGILFPI